MEKNIPMSFELSADLVNELDDWQQGIKKKHGKYGHYTYSFTPTGIGTIINVYSEEDNSSIDLSHAENW